MNEPGDPAKYLKQLPMSVVILTVGRGVNLRAQITTVSYATLSPLRLVKIFPSSSTTLKAVLDTQRLALSIASFENLKLVEGLASAKISKEELQNLATAWPMFSSPEASCYIPDALFALDCRVEKTVVEEDYVMVVSRVENFYQGSGNSPLIRFEHAYGSIGDTIPADDNYPI